MYHSQSDISTISGGCGSAAALASVAVVAVAAAMVAATAEMVAAEVAVGATAAVAIAFTPFDLMRFRLRYLNFLDCVFHYSLEIILRNFE